MAGQISKADVIDCINEVIDALAKFSDRIDREVELVVRPDGTATLMGAEAGTVAGEPASGFKEIESFDSLPEMWAFLKMAEAA
jgi:hypothetical protein